MERLALTKIVLTFPIQAGKVEAWRRFCQELSGSRQRQYEASRQRLGITHERMALMENSLGATAVTTLEAPDVARALGLLISSDHAFDIWYRERLHELHGIHLVGYERYSQSMPPQDPDVHFDWVANSAMVEDTSSTFMMKSRQDKDDER